MPSFWDNLFRSDSYGPQRHHNLQEGLFQIASQTCSILVQVNNTKNISYGNNATNISYSNFDGAATATASSSQADSAPGGGSSGTISTRTKVNVSATSSPLDQEQLVVLIPPSTGPSVGQKFNTFDRYRHRLSTVLESGASDDDTHLWSNQGYMRSGDSDDGHTTRWNNQGWCKPSCIPITIILILIFLVVLLPLLDHAMEEDNILLNKAFHERYNDCPKSCRVSLVESIPQGLVYSNGSITFPSTFNTWMDLVKIAEHSIDIGSFYWTLRKSEIYPDPSSSEGEEVFQEILNAGVNRGIKIRIAQNAPTQSQPNIDTELLVKRKAAEVRSLNFAQLLGGGVLHTKVWVVDRKHVYVGSANMDWRSLTQVKELGIVIHNCSCIAEDMTKIFEIYWTLGEKGASIPEKWPVAYSTKFNMEKPLNLSLNNFTFQTYISSSPPQFCAEGRTSDIDAIIDIISKAEKFVYISVMDYFPLTIYTPRIKYWGLIDTALRTIAIDHNVKVKMLISWWNHSRPAEDYFLKSLADISESYHGVDIEIKRFIVPHTDAQNKIPFARVNHNKYMVTDNTAYIGTSNWSGDYFINTAGIGVIMHDPVLNRNQSDVTVRAQLQAIFERDWNSEYSHSIPK